MKMSERGGKCLYERGIGEASTTVYDRFDQWKSGFFKVLPQVCAFCQLRVRVPTSLQNWLPTPNLPSKNTFKVELHDITERHQILRQGKEQDLFAARVLENKILTSPSHTEVARQIGACFPHSLLHEVLRDPQTLDFIIMSVRTIKYSPGDTVAM